MQCFQFSRSLAFFCQISVREQNPDVMCNTAQQIAIIRAIGLTMKLLAQRHKGRELPWARMGNRAPRLKPPRDLSRKCPDRFSCRRPSSINTGSSFFKSCTMTGWESSIGTGSFSVAHRTELEKPTIGFPKRPD